MLTELFLPNLVREVGGYSGKYTCHGRKIYRQFSAQLKYKCASDITILLVKTLRKENL